MNRDVFVSKDEHTDSDGDTTYYITYRSSTGTWNKRVNWRVYSAAKEGDTTESAYVEDFKKPIFSYSGRTGVF